MRGKSLNLEIKKYIMDVQSYLICDWQTKRRFIKDLKNDIVDFVDENENVTIDDVRRRFGEPKDIAMGFFENADIKKIKRRMNIGRIISVGIAMALFIWVAAVTIAVIDLHNEEPGYFVDEMYDGIVQGEIIDDTVGE